MVVVISVMIMSMFVFVFFVMMRMVVMSVIVVMSMVVVVCMIVVFFGLFWLLDCGRCMIMVRDRSDSISKAVGRFNLNIDSQRNL